MPKHGLDRLTLFAQQPLLVTRGWSFCMLDTACGSGKTVQYGNTAIPMRDAQLRIIGADGTIYATPHL